MPRLMTRCTEGSIDPERPVGELRGERRPRRGGADGGGFAFRAVASVSALVLRDAVVTTILNVVIAVPLFGLVRRVIRPVLLAKPVGRRRRAATRETGPLGLRGLEI